MSNESADNTDLETAIAAVYRGPLEVSSAGAMRSRSGCAPRGRRQALERSAR